MSSQQTVASNTLHEVSDVLVIGAGPAGLSAALALGRVRRNVVVFDSGEYRNQASSHVHTVPTHDNKNPAVLRQEMAAELKAKYKTILLAGTGVKTVGEVGAVFELEDANGQLWKGRKVILATGSCDIMLEIPGYKELWGKSICPFCHGFEETGAPNGATLITADDAASVTIAITFGQIARQFSPNMTVLTNGQAHLEADEKIVAAKAHGFDIDSRPIRKLTPGASGASLTVEFEDGSTTAFGFLYHRPPTKTRGDFAQQLGLELTPTGDIMIANMFQQTSKRGVFAAGDCATMMKQVTVAMGTGVTAGGGANMQIIEDEFAQGWW